MSIETTLDEPVDVAEGLLGIPEVEVPAPTGKEKVHPADQVGKGEAACLGFGQLQDALLGSLHRLMGGSQTQIGPSPVIAVRPEGEGETEEIEGDAFLTQSQASALLAVDLQTHIPFYPPLQPMEQAGGEVAGQDQEVIGVAHQAGLSPNSRTLRMMERTV
jgi:hypothetical protein